MSLFRAVALVAVATVANLIHVPVAAQSRRVESSVAAGDSVYLVESAATSSQPFSERFVDPTVRRYDASSGSLEWEASVTAGLPGREHSAIHLQTDAAGNIVAAA